MSEKLPEEKLEECKMVFALFDYEQKGVLPTSLLENLYKSLGAYVPSDELRDFISRNPEGIVNYDRFIDFFTEQYNRKLDAKVLINAFAFLDHDKKGVYSGKDLKHALHVLGDKLSEDEVSDMIDDYMDKSGNIDYKKFSQEMAK